MNVRPEPGGRWGEVNRSAGKKEDLRKSLKSDRPPSQTKGEKHRELEERGVVRAVDRGRSAREREAITAAAEIAADEWEDFDESKEEETIPEELSAEAENALIDLGVDIPPDGFSSKKEIEDVAFDGAEDLWHQMNDLKPLISRVKQHGGFYKDNFGVQVPLIRENDSQVHELKQLKEMANTLTNELGFDDLTAAEIAIIEQQSKIEQAMEKLADAGYDVPEYNLNPDELAVLAELATMRDEESGLKKAA